MSYSSLVLPVLVGIAFVGGFAWLIQRGMKHHQNEQLAWRRSALALGLTFARGRHSWRPIESQHHLPEMYGQYDGSDVYVGVRSYTIGSGEDSTTHYRTYVDCVFDVRLKRGLSVAPAGAVSQFFGQVFGEHDVQIGHREFDKAFRIKGFEPAQVRNLVAHSTVPQLLLGQPGGFDASVDDTRVRYEYSGVQTSASALAAVLPVATAAYKQILESWHQLPLSDTEQWVDDNWSGALAGLGFTFEPKGMIASSQLDYGKLFIEVCHEESKWQTDFLLTIEPPLGAGLRLERQTALKTLGKWFGAEDLLVGDGEFDRTFMVQGTDKARVRDILGAESRAIILSLFRAFDDVWITDQCWRFRHAGLPDGPRIKAFILEMEQLAVALTAHRWPQSRGPYR